jgi:D-glycero-alpha-D-manno-heptose-7-phosphate kinase
MIITRSPLRITLGGGGTDIPSYFRKHEGFLISAAINKYVYVNVTRPFTKGIYLKYSKLEKVDKISDIKHPIIRETLKMLKYKKPQIEITTLADIPAGTGLGSSGSFTTALLKALYSFSKLHLNQEKLAELACEIEIDRLGEPIGKQDQYISAVGGLNTFTFHKNNEVTIKPIDIKYETIFDLEDNLLLFFTGISRSASKVLKEQDDKSKKNDLSIIKNLNHIKDLAYRSRAALERGKNNILVELMHEHWETKKLRSI